MPDQIMACGGGTEQMDDDADELAQTGVLPRLEAEVRDRLQ